MKVGIKTISELSGFSIATVSNVLNNKGSVSYTHLDVYKRQGRSVPQINTHPASGYCNV